jgi:hypothetical protein
MSSDQIIAVAGLLMTVAMFALGIIVGVLGWFLKRHMDRVEVQLAELPGIRQDLAVIVERQVHHTHRADRHSELLADHARLLSAHEKLLAVLGRGTP